jgi:hypothetical protein
MEIDMKKLLGTLALAGFVGLTACERRDEGDVFIEDPVVEQPAPAPVITEPAPLPPMTTDTLILEDTLPAETTLP